MKFCLFFLLLSITTIQAIEINRTAENQKRAFRTSINAIDSYPKIKALKKEYEVKTLRALGISKRDITPYLTFVAIGYQKRLTTGYLRKLNFKYNEWNIKPEAQYYFSDNYTIVMINFSKEW